VDFFIKVQSFVQIKNAGVIWVIQHDHASSYVVHHHCVDDFFSLRLMIRTFQWWFLIISMVSGSLVLVSQLLAIKRQTVSLFHLVPQWRSGWVEQRGWSLEHTNRISPMWTWRHLQCCRCTCRICLLARTPSRSP
jgi:hypothetical protein